MKRNRLRWEIVRLALDRLISLHSYWEKGIWLQTNELVSQPFPKDGIYADRRFVKDEQIGLVEKSHSERDTALLSTAERLDKTVRRRQIEQLEQEFHLRLDEGWRQLVDTTEVFKSLLDAKFSVKGQFLGHVSDTTTRNATLYRSGLTAKHHHFTAVETATSDNTAQQRCFTATAGTQESVSWYQRWIICMLITSSTHNRNRVMK